MKLKNKILMGIIVFTIYSCSKNPTTNIIEGENITVNVSIPYFWFSGVKTIDYFSFYGREITTKVDNDILNDIDLEDNDTAQIRDLVENLKKNNFDKTVQMLIAQAKEMELDDFGYRLLLKEFVKEILPSKSKNFNQVIIWYGLRTNDLDAVLCTKDNKIFCYCDSERGVYFVRSGESICSHDYNHDLMYTLNIAETSYWNDDKNICPEGMSILDFDLFQDHKKNDFTFSNKIPKLGKVIFSKKRSFTYKGQKYHLKTSYNKFYVRYLNDIPMKNLSNYVFTREFSQEVKESFKSVPIWLANKTIDQQIDFLLTLVDESFPHSGGDKIEKYNYVEQSMKDSYVDCEDRAAMFCYLIKEFTRLKTSLVVNHNHAWSVVSQSNNLTRDHIIMCDPGLEIGKMIEPDKPYIILDP